MFEDVDIIAGNANAVRTYSALNGMDDAAAYAQRKGLRVSAGASLGPDEMFKSEGGVGSHWGVMASNRTPKPGLSSSLLAPAGALPPRRTAKNPTWFSKDERTYSIYTEWQQNTDYVPSGAMGDTWALDTDECWLRNPHAGKSATHVGYWPQRDAGVHWAGTYWQTPSGNWGDEPGGKDLRGYNRLVFYARGDHGGETIHFFTGGITGRHGDTLKKHQTDVRLTKDWRQYTIDLPGGPAMRRIVGAFGWSASLEENPRGGVGFCLDDIEFIRR
ncbi:hypothetical protein [Streptomyces sp. NPDC046909]|uniref:hypothetical protein n=1 Tax=Streptomyces sp. NPDC046909 TaxID=3155617 RepID=UPI0033C2C016